MSDPFHLGAEEMRRLGYRIIDTLVDHYSRLPELPASLLARPEQLDHLRERLPQHPTDFDTLMKRVTGEVFAPCMRTHHPNFVAFIPSPNNYVSALSHALVAGYNAFAGTWFEAAGPAQVELTTLEWLRQQVGYPKAGGGLFLSGGSMANLTALALAQHHRNAEVVYCSDQTHSSVFRAARVLGLAVETVGSEDGRMKLEDLPDHRRAVVVANAGTTNTGAVDPLQKLGALAQERGFWLHVDGAYGAAAVFCAEGKRLLEGLSLADSIALDGHKWLFQPYELGCLLVQREEELEQAFAVTAPYLDDLATVPGEVNFCDRGLQLTRSFRALPLWMSLHYFGGPAFSRAIEIGLENGRELQRLVEVSSDWELVTPAQLGIVTFRHRRLDDAGHQRLSKLCWERGYCVFSTTLWEGRVVMRACPIHPGLETVRLAQLLEHLSSLVD